MLLSLLAVVFEEGLADSAYLAERTTGADALARQVAPFPPEATADITGIPADRLRQLARDFASAGSASAYGRTGTCLGRFGTLVAYLLDALNAATGNLDRPGGSVFGRAAIALDDIGERAGLATYGKVRSRIGGYPDVIGNMPATLLPLEMTTPGERQIRAFFVSAGNPVLSVPDGNALEDALEGLDLMVSLDLYVNETNKHADYVLPSTTWLEREDLPVALMGFFTTPFIQMTEAVVEPRGEARQEWEIIEDIARSAGLVASSTALLRKLRIRLKPRWMIDAALRTGPGRLSIAKLKRHPHGIVLGDYPETGVLGEKIRHPDGRVRLDPPPILAELRRLCGEAPDDGTLRLIGMRELRSHNSWMHNAPLLLRGGRTHALRVHPDDAAAFGLEDGADARVTSKSGSLEVAVMVTDEMTPGTVALPHGYLEANANALTAAGAAALEPLAGMSHLNGVPVEVSAAG
jgi:formate dehydrogenase